MISKLEGPEELESPYFKIQGILEPHNLVETSKRILQAVNTKPTLTYSYCLEVVFEDDKAFFTLCLNPVLWFNVYLRKKGLEASVRIARIYVTNTQWTVSYENYKIASFEVEYSETVKNSAFKLCKYGSVSRRYIDSLTNIDNSLEHDHSDVICKGTSKTQDERDIVCNFYVLDDLVL
ncbi:9774_t:CDS:2 [Funneliformis geosporum]|uniref:10119_t:CDS:1 n=1 Tax=Funneliformis geosporum TaxID=1117311 RepID=A0A9W4T0X8_9GLOM|nr:10119_t:CDS:2 [Funneliformis geosporum]CAI2192942.1 9774_t:CDS:2 [Funneliformis geosporum]